MYTALLYVHVLALVYWLGGDLGTFLSSRYVLRRDLSVESRQTALLVQRRYGGERAVAAVGVLVVHGRPQPHKRKDLCDARNRTGHAALEGLLHGCL